MERVPARVEQIGDLRAKLRRAQGGVAVVVPSGGASGAVERELAARGIPVRRYGQEASLPAPAETATASPSTSPEAAVRLDIARRLAFVDGERVDLPPKEFDLLAELVARGGRPVSAAELAKRAWPPDEHASADDVHRHIYRLRRALGPRGAALIANRRGFGYVLEA